MEKHVDGTSVRLVLNDDLTANNVPVFNDEVDDNLKNSNSMDELVLDLVNTENIDSVGVTFVIGLYKRVKDEGKLFRVVGASQDVQSLFKLMKLDQFFEMEA
ncbi:MULTISPECIES: STAS domain-containing protein [unclassified Fusibacter]|uniref:STAS domain-containing protein n=1 Tax=unclassified Fusibacter TaxID=2624464 RepID=UPI001012D8EA|nr:MULTISPECIES: STAS domain-containing protein [unclassified Fusibacter]MCK8060791.1 STAS domain-containing protein [Fusibacter sp. A2]NPE23087.1 STAS domain-containing protein [Fusibacter sp. A1]RXV59757.1 anti-sigma factor antagonist [Fusibacter sp. A1]